MPLCRNQKYNDMFRLQNSPCLEIRNIPPIVDVVKSLLKPALAALTLLSVLQLVALYRFMLQIIAKYSIKIF